MPISDPQQVYFASQYPIDKVLGTFEGSFTASAGGSPTRTTESISTSIPESTLFQGIFSIDGGTTWRDFGKWLQAGLNIDVFGRSTANTLAVIADNFSSSVTVMYKVALIAKPNQGDITPQPAGADIIFDSRLNYQKVLLDEARAISITNGNQGTESFTHSLGYIPKVRSFIEISSSYGANTPAGLYETGHFALEAFSAGATASGSNFESTSGVQLTTSVARAVLKNSTGRGNFSGTLFMRIYYDA